MSDTPDNRDDDKAPTLGAEIMDREERKAQKRKLREAAKKEREQDEIEIAVTSTKLGAVKKAKKRQLMKRGAYALGGLFLVWMGSYLFSPFQAGPGYGICRVYLENTIRYPLELRLSAVEDLRPLDSAPDSIGGVRIWYTQIDAFGAYRMENIQCYFKQDPQVGTMIDQIMINRRPVDPAKVKAFNDVLGVVAGNMPDLAYPEPLADSLEDLQIDSDSFRKQLMIRKQ